MKGLLVALLLAPALVFGSAMTPPTPDACPGNPPTPPSLAASGTSPDGPVCLQQSVRDSRGTVWQFTAAPCPGWNDASHCLVASVGSITKAVAPKVKILGGVVQYQNQFSPQFVYWNYTKSLWEYVGTPPY